MRSVRTVRDFLLGGFLLLLTGVPPAAAQVGSPAGPVPPELLRARRAAFMDALKGVPALVSATLPRNIEGDYPQDSDFRQSNDFFYLTGLETPKAWLALNLPRPGGTVLYVPPRRPEEEVWTGPQPGPGPEVARIAGVEDVRSLPRLEQDLASWLGGEGTDGSHGPMAGPAVYVRLGSASHRDRVSDALGGDPLDLRDAGPILARLRQVKDREELRRLRKAVEITAEGLAEAMRLAEPGLHEYELEAALEYVFRRQGAERLGFPSIVGTGLNTVVLHYDENRRRTEAGDLALIDVGAEFGYYSADITRTFPVSGRFSDRQRALYELVLGAQEAALDEIRPGVRISDLERAARRYLAEHSGDLCGPRSCAGFFVHGLSHWLGMDVHDVGSYGVPLEAGMVLTVEPGVYLPDEGVGIRIEDDVLVTEEGYEILSRGIPRDVEAVEALMNEDLRWLKR